MLSVFASGAGLASFASDLAGVSAFTVSVASFVGASGSTAGVATFSSVTVSGFVSTSIPIFFLIFSAILADLPVLSLR